MCVCAREKRGLVPFYITPSTSAYLVIRRRERDARVRQPQNLEPAARLVLDLGPPPHHPHEVPPAARGRLRLRGRRRVLVAQVDGAGQGLQAAICVSSVVVGGFVMMTPSNDIRPTARRNPPKDAPVPKRPLPAQIQLPQAPQPRTVRARQRVVIATRLPLSAAELMSPRQAPDQDAHGRVRHAPVAQRIVLLEV